MFKTCNNINTIEVVIKLTNVSLCTGPLHVGTRAKSRVLVASNHRYLQQFV